MISGLVRKYRKGLRFVMVGRYVSALPASSPIALTMPDAFIRTRAPLAFLSPRIQIAIRDGTAPPELTLHRIVQRPIPLDWQEQERLYGI